MEIWRDVVGYVGLYKVSNLGKIKSLDRSAYRLGKTKTGFRVELKGKILRQKLNHGYCHVNLYLEGERTTLKVHRLVAEAFIKNPLNKPNVNHKDRNKINNKKGNLEWCTQLENIKHSRKLGSYKHLDESNPLAKLTEDEVHTICNMLDNSEGSYREIAALFKVGYQAVKNIDTGFTWSRITGRKKV